MRVALWQPFPSFHQQGFYQALGRCELFDRVELWVEEVLPTSRQQAGWLEACPGGIEVKRISPEILPEDSEGQIHLFTGFGTHSKVWQAENHIPMDRKSRVYAYTEAPEFTGPVGKLRQLKFQHLARKLKGRLNGVLATGEQAVRFYRDLPGMDCPVFPFGYYDGETPVPDARVTQEQPDVPRLLIAGQLIRRKGVDLVLEALAGSPDWSWELRIAGEGPEESGLRRQVEKFGIGSRVCWLGVLNREQLMSEYRHARCLLLPSRFDGWGMTVNEALREGCPVRVSTQAGAASLVPEGWRMEPTVASIRTSVRSLLEEGNPAQESAIALNCAKQTTGEVGVEKLLRILNR